MSPPKNPKIHRKGHSKRVKRFAEEFEDLGLDPDTTLDVDDILKERRHLMTATFVAFCTLFFWIITIATSYWVTVDSGHPDGIYMNHTKVSYFHGHMGLFRMCRTITRHDWIDGKPGERTEECRFFYVNPKKADYSTDSMLDRTILEYTRSQIAFSVVSILLILMAVAFSIYTFAQPRYMFKRLAGGVHFITAGVILVMVEIAGNNADYEREHFHLRHPLNASWSYGISYFMAWLCLLTYGCVGILFFVYSRKRKLDIADDRGFALS